MRDFTGTLWRVSSNHAIPVYNINREPSGYLYPDDILLVLGSEKCLKHDRDRFILIKNQVMRIRELWFLVLPGTNEDWASPLQEIKYEK